ncbi:MAG: hypothetical protein CMG46_02925 [Candidatus Marinimicrobia bacterium]|nr:hypothetical protein [Candidatus Neomarinimicrobiota bacterium]|tara:strand:- start:66 stop:440 length:375 start_codon:yes stop_codon:yes gene_type:complete
MKKELIQKIAIVLFFIMFIYSGLMKITNFSKKTAVLSTKTNLPFPINELGMIGVIILEVIGSLYIVYYFLYGGLDKEIIQKICQAFIVFLIVVTYLYHPPWDKMIPFLSNVTTTGGLLLIYNLI